MALELDFREEQTDTEKLNHLDDVHLCGKAFFGILVDFLTPLSFLVTIEAFEAAAEFGVDPGYVALQVCVLVLDSALDGFDQEVLI